MRTEVPAIREKWANGSLLLQETELRPWYQGRLTPAQTYDPKPAQKQQEFPDTVQNITPVCKVENCLHFGWSFHQFCINYSIIWASSERCVVCSVWKELLNTPTHLQSNTSVRITERAMQVQHKYKEAYSFNEGSCRFSRSNRRNGSTLAL